MDARRGDKDPGDQIRREPLTVIHGRDPVADRFTHFLGADQTAKGNGDTDGRQCIGNIKGLLGVRSSGVGVGEAAWLCAALACLVGCWPLRGARFGLGPTRRTNGPVLGADMQGIDGLRGGTSSNQGGQRAMACRVGVGYAAKSHFCWGGALEGKSGGGSVGSPTPCR